MTIKIKLQLKLIKMVDYLDWQMWCLTNPSLFHCHFFVDKKLMLTIL